MAGTVYRVQASITYAGGSAHLDREVTFGNAAAKAQQNYGGPRVSSHHNTAWVYIAASALALIILLGFAWRITRGLPRRAAALAFLHSELTASQPGGRPLTVIHLDVGNALARPGAARPTPCAAHCANQIAFMTSIETGC